MPICRKCKVELTDKNWAAHRQANKNTTGKNTFFCNECWRQKKAEYNKRTGRPQHDYQLLKQRVKERLWIEFVRRGSKCESCSNTDVEVIEIHHTSYAKGRNCHQESRPSSLLKVPLKTLKFLCANCHVKKHGKGYFHERPFPTSL